MKKNKTISGLVLITTIFLVSCGKNGAKDEDIATKTFSSGYYYLFFKAYFHFMKKDIKI